MEVTLVLKVCTPLVLTLLAQNKSQSKYPTKSLYCQYCTSFLPFHQTVRQWVLRGEHQHATIFILLFFIPSACNVYEKSPSCAAFPSAYKNCR